MGLRAKTLVVVAAVLLVVLAALTWASSTLLISSFEELERDAMVRDVRRVRDALSESIVQMDVKLSDWSGWEEASRFAAGQHETFQDDNLSPEVFGRLHVHLMVFLDDRGAVVWSGMLNETADQFVSVPDDLLAELAVGKPLRLSSNVDDARSGLVGVRSGVFQVASRNLLNNEGKGPTRGVLMWGRKLGEPDRARLAEICHVGVAFALISQADQTDPQGHRPDDSVRRDAKTGLLGTAKIDARAIDDSTVVGQTTLLDIHGRDIVKLMVTTGREIMARGRATNRSIIMVACGCAIGFAVLVVAILTRFVTSRVSHLAAQIHSVATSGDPMARVVVRCGGSHDEIGDLATAVNGMLASLSAVQSQLVEARDAAESASLAKSQFLANMSHEIRTPMTAILGFADLLAEPTLTESERFEHVGTICRNGEHLLGIINDILDLAKIEAGKMQLEIAPVAPLAVLREIRHLLHVRAAAKAIELRFEPKFPLPALVATDALRLRQILVNLIGNAIKFTPRGSVTVGVSFCEVPTPSLKITVADEGIGMTPAQLSRLFAPFSQADASTARKFGGTGLGLSISRKLALLLGGDITAQSKPGSGSCFTVVLPTGPIEPRQLISHAPTDLNASPALDVAPPASPTGVLAGVRVLLAEDGPDNQRLISFHLRKAGATVDIAGNGLVAVSMAKEAIAAGQPHDVVLMDMQMPELDGYGATRRLRDASFAKPIFALTANAMAGDRDRCLASGCDGYLSKPIDAAGLIAACATAARDGRTPSAQAPAQAPVQAPVQARA